MSPTRSRSTVRYPVVTGVLGFLLIASIVSGSIAAFYSVLFIALVYAAIALMTRPRDRH